MIYEISLDSLPYVNHAYYVQRRTVWQIADPDALFIFAAEGRCQIKIDNDKYILERGCAVLIPQSRHYVRRPIDNEMCNLYYAHVRLREGVNELTEAQALDFISSRSEERRREVFSGRISPSERSHRYLLAPFINLSHCYDEALSLFREMSDTFRSHRTDSATRCSIAAMRLILLWALHERDFADLPLPKNKGSHRLREVLSYIHEHAKEMITLDDLCAFCNFSKQHLIRVFRSEFGQTPKAYILEHKINVAKELFYRNPYLSVKEAADEMGFEDQHYFSRLFAKVTGTTPTGYKKHLINFDPNNQ